MNGYDSDDLDRQSWNYNSIPPVRSTPINYPPYLNNTRQQSFESPNTTSGYNNFDVARNQHISDIPYDSYSQQPTNSTNYFDSPHLPQKNRFIAEEHHDDSRFTPYREIPELGQNRQAPNNSNEVSELLALYSSNLHNTPSSSRQIPFDERPYRNPQPYFPFRNPDSEPTHSARSSRPVDPLREVNRSRIHQPPTRLANHIGQDRSSDQINPRANFPHRSYSLPNNPIPPELYGQKSPNYWDSIRPDINPFCDPNEQAYYYYSRDPYREEHRLDTSILDNLLDPTDYSSYSDEEMAKSTTNWKNSFSAKREKFGTEQEFPYHEYTFATNGSLTLPRNGTQLGKVLAKSASQSAILGQDDDHRLSILKQAVDRRASEAPESRQPQLRSQNALSNFWMGNVQGQNKPGPQKIPFGMTAAERLQQLQEPVDASSTLNGGSDTYSSSSSTSFSQTIPSGFDGVASRKLHYLQNAYRDSESPFIERRSMTPSSGILLNGGPNFSKLDNAIAEMAGEVRKTDYSLKNAQNNGCARFPVDDSKYSGFNKNYSPKHSDDNKPIQHSPSPEMLNENIAELPHPRPKHNIREQLMNAGVIGSTFYGPYPGRRQGSPAPMFPTPTSGSVAHRISAFERRPGTPNLLQIACALTSVAPAEPRSPGPKSPLGMRETVFKTKPVIHVDYGGKSVSKSSLSPEYDENGSVFKFPDQSPYKNDASISPRWRGDDTGEALPVTRDVTKSIANHSTPKSVNSNKELEFPGTPIKPLNFDSTTESITPNSKRKNAPLSLPPIRTPQLARLKSSSIAGKLANIQRFHYPFGKPVSKEENDRRLNQIREIFAAHPQSQLPYTKMEDVCKVMDFAIYTKRAVFEACCRLANKSIDDQTPLNFREFNTYWNEMVSKAHDEASRFIYTLALAGSGERDRNYITKEDFTSMLMDLIHTHPGLHFLADAPQFHARYVDVVVGRIFWNVNRSWTGRITAKELRKSNFLETLRLVDDTNDINKITDYFSYEHFYVTYCKFWEIDTDHDMVVSRQDMRNHCGGALTNRIIDRIFSSAVIRTPANQRIYGHRGPVHEQPIETIGFEHFVSFLLAEEDKRHPTSIEYWFRCLDLDGDGMISLYEMEYFYHDIERKLLDKNFETLSFNDVVCNLLDLVAPTNSNCVTLKDLRRCGLAHRFFNTFINYIKYCEQESSDGERASVKMNGDKEMSDWDQFCAVEYEMLMAETEQNDGYADESIDVNLDDDDGDVPYP